MLWFIVCTLYTLFYHGYKPKYKLALNTNKHFSYVYTVQFTEYVMLANTDW